MLPDDPFSLLAVFVPLIVGMALWAPPQWLLFADIVLVIFRREWLLAGVHFDLTDLVLAGLAMAFAFGRAARPTRRAIPYFWPWVCLGILQSAAYLYAPVNQEYLGYREESWSFIRYLASIPATAYQLYRYCWRPILFYPLAVRLVTDRRKFDALCTVVVVTGVGCAVMATLQSFAGGEAAGPFLTKNELGGVLIMPCVVALSGALSTESRWRRRFYAVAFLVIARGLLSSGSKGAFVGVLGSVGFLFAFLLTSQWGRWKIVRMTFAGLLLGFVVLGLKPDLFERPSVKGMLVATQGTEAETMQWRLENRWPYFWHKALDNFWLGTGTDVEPEFEECPTPHNGYLGMAMVSGIPSVLLVLGFSLSGIRNGIVAFRLRKQSSWMSGVGIMIPAAILGVLIHNVVDATLTQPFNLKLFWAFTALAATVARRPRAFEATAARTSARTTRVEGAEALPLNAVGARP